MKAKHFLFALVALGALFLALDANATSLLISQFQGHDGFLIAPAAAMTLPESIKAELDRIHNGLKQPVDEMRVRLNQVEQVFASGAGNTGVFGGSKGSSWGADVLNSEKFEGFVEGGTGKARFEVSAAVTSVTGSGGDFVVPDRVGVINLPERRLRVRDVLLSSMTSSNTLEYLKQVTRTNAAAAVAEGGTKPESVLAWEPETAPIRTLATVLPATKQIFDDAPMLRSLIDNQLRYMLGEVEENQLLNGDGTGANILGLIPQATAYAAPFDPAGTETMLDIVLLAMAQNAAAGYETDFIILNPLDWVRMQLLKDAEGRYLGSGPFTDSDVARLWRTPVVPTLAMTVDKFLVGTRMAAQVFDRQNPVVEISFDHSDFFIKNMVMFRAEERLGLAVFRPDALIYGDFGNVA